MSNVEQVFISHQCCLHQQITFQNYNQSALTRVFQTREKESPWRDWITPSKIILIITWYDLIKGLLCTKLPYIWYQSVLSVTPGRGWTVFSTRTSSPKSKVFGQLEISADVNFNWNCSWRRFWIVGICRHNGQILADSLLMWKSVIYQDTVDNRLTVTHVHIGIASF